MVDPNPAQTLTLHLLGIHHPDTNPDPDPVPDPDPNPNSDPWQVRQGNSMWMLHAILDSAVGMLAPVVRAYEKRSVAA